MELLGDKIQIEVASHEKGEIFRRRVGRVRLGPREGKGIEELRDS